jgi:hypothetical protein
VFIIWKAAGVSEAVGAAVTGGSGTTAPQTRGQSNEQLGIWSWLLLSCSPQSGIVLAISWADWSGRQIDPVAASALVTTRNGMRATSRIRRRDERSAFKRKSPKVTVLHRPAGPNNGEGAVHIGL